MTFLINPYIPTLTYLTNKINKYGAFDFSDQQITSLPDTIGDLENLKKFYLSNNNLKKLPDSIGNCQNLRAITLTGNRFNKLFDLIIVLSKITYLYISGFPQLSLANTKPITNNDSTIRDSEYDVVIINPICGGEEDYELAKK